MTSNVEEHKRRRILVWKKRVVFELLSPGKGNSTEARSLQEATLKRFQCFGDTETFSSAGENWGQQMLRFCITNNALLVFNTPIKQHERKLDAFEISGSSPILPSSTGHSPFEKVPRNWSTCVLQARHSWCCLTGRSKNGLSWRGATSCTVTSSSSLPSNPMFLTEATRSQLSTPW